MKLVENEHAHLPDAMSKNSSGLSRQLRRLFQKALSKDGQTVLIGLGLTLLLSLVLSFNFFSLSAKGVDHNGISLKDYYAESRISVVDEEATERKMARARQAVEPIYQDVAPHNQDIQRSLEKLVSDLAALNQDEELSSGERRQRFLDLLGTEPEAATVYNRFFEEPIPQNEWNRLTNATRKALQTILSQGLTENEDLQNRETVIAKAIPRYGYSRQYSDLVYFLVDATLEPNRIIDESAMAMARDRAARAVEPVVQVYKPNEKIVDRGEVISPVQMAALKKMGKLASGINWIASLGVFLLSVLFVFSLWSYLYNFNDKEFYKPAYAWLMSSLVFLTVIMYQMFERGPLSEVVPAVAFPLGTFALIVSVFTHPRIAVLATALVVFLIGLTLRSDFYSLSALLFGSVMGVYVLSKRINFSDRGQLMYAGFFIGLTNAVIFAAITPLNPQIFSDISLSQVFSLLIWSFMGGIFSGILTLGSLYLLESIFNLITPFKLMELGNHDQPLLKRMQFEAPGTFHHSLMVATLAEAAAEAIGANPLLTRVGCLYHDIGKMKRPLFFIENQAYFGAENPHDKLTPRLSKMVITAHPRDSLEMARQHRLPEVLMKFMTEHHGTLTAGYFYNKACIEEGAENVNKSQFRYPGPKPNIKETAIVMLADACESAVKALKSPTVAQVEERIDKIIQQRIEDGQFDICPITFKDIETIKQTFLRVFRGIQHNRIEYQQNIMRELGRKLPANTVTEASGLQEVLQQVKERQQTASPTDGGGSQGTRE